MFQTEIIKSIQSIASVPLTHFILIINELGTHEIIFIILVIIIFGADFKKGVFISNIVIWNYFAIELIKDYFALPRPADVDAGVKLIGSENASLSRVESFPVRGFFEKLPGEIVDQCRSVKNYPYGFPSGHTCSTVVLWGSTSILFQKRWIIAVTIALILMMPFSRLYLGKHFLIDVLGGLAAGAVIITFVFTMILKGEKKEKILSQAKMQIKVGKDQIFQLIYLLAVPCMVLIITRSDFAAQILGINLGFLLIGIQSYPDDCGKLPQRMGRIAIALLVFFATDYLVQQLLQYFTVRELRALKLAKTMLSFFIMIWGTTKLCLWFGFYKTGNSIRGCPANS